jgi:YggT family protein
MTHLTDTGRVRSITGRQVTFEHEAVNQEILNRVTGLAQLGIGVLNSLILLRYFLKMMGANAVNDFARLINSATDPFLSMFKGLIPTLTYQGFVFEFYDLIAMAAYGMLAWAIVQLLRVLFARVD